MSDITLIIIVVVGSIVVVLAMAFIIERSGKAESQTGKPSRFLQILAIALGTVSGGIFVDELLFSTTIQFFWPLAAFALISYGVVGLIKK